MTAAEKWRAELGAIVGALESLADRGSQLRLDPKTLTTSALRRDLRAAIERLDRLIGDAQ